MKLYYHPASPFVRKVLVLAHETGLAPRLEKVVTKTLPVAPDAALSGSNPLSKIPALILDDGSTLYDSRVICEYLDTLHDGARMFPETGDARWTAARRQALADGMLDAAVVTRYETFIRPQALRWSDWIENQKLKFRRGLDALESEASGFDAMLDIGTVSVGCVLGYLDFRYPDEGWRQRCPKLAAWSESFGARPSMQATTPADLA